MTLLRAVGGPLLHAAHPPRQRTIGLAIINALHREGGPKHDPLLPSRVVGEADHHAVAEANLPTTIGLKTTTPGRPQVVDPAVGEDLDAGVIVDGRLGGIADVELLPAGDRVALHQVEHEANVRITLGDRINHAGEHLGATVQRVETHRQVDEEQQTERQIQVARPVLPVEQRRPNLAVAGAPEQFGQPSRRARARGPRGAVGSRLRHRHDHRMPTRQRLPGRAVVNRPERLRADPPVEAAGHLVAMRNQCVGLQIVEPVEVGTDARHLRLHHRMHAVRILVGVDDVRHGQEMEAILVTEVFSLQLPDAVPEDVGGADRLGDEAQGRVAKNLKRLTGVTDDHSVIRTAAVVGEPGEAADAEVVVDPAVGERLRRKLTLVHTEIVGRDLNGGKETRKRRGGAHHLGNRRRLPCDVPKGISFTPLPLLDVQALAVENSHHAVADVRGEHVQRRLLGEFEEPAVTVEKRAVVLLQERVGREVRSRPAGELADEPDRKQQRQAADDPVANVVLHEPDHLAGRLGELGIGAVVAVPVEDEVGGQDAAPRHRRDVADQGQ